MSQELEGTLTNSANLVGNFGSEGGGGTSNYNDLINKPSINSVTLQGNKTASQLGFANVATSGSYDDLTNKPTIPAAQVNSDWNASSGVAEILNKPTLSAVATSGSYDDLTNKPTIPAAQVNSDWNAVSGVAEILNKPTVPANATDLPISGNDTTDTKSYIDTGLSGKANKSWTSIGTITDGGTGKNVSAYSEILVIVIINNAVKYNSYVFPVSAIGTGGINITVNQRNDYWCVGSLKVNNDILTYNQSLLSTNWTSSGVIVYGR